MPPRRPHNTGSIRDRGPVKDSSGAVIARRWQLRLYAGIDPTTEKPRQHVRTITAKTKRDAQKALDDFAREMGRDGPTTTKTVGQLLDEYMMHSEARGRAPRTVHEGRREATVISGELGRIQVAKLTPRHLDDFYRKLLEGKIDTRITTKQRGDGAGRALSPSSVRRFHGTISAALNQAIKWGWITRNPAKLASPPGLPKRELVIPSRDEINAIVTAARAEDERRGMLLAIAALTGMRRGELCGLKWEDIGPGGLRVRRSLYRLNGVSGEKSPKGGSGRDVALDPMSMALLGAWRAQCEKWAVDAGEDPARLVYVVSTSANGKTPVNPDVLSSFVYRQCKKLGLGHIHLHSFRHWVVTETLASGASVRDVADFVGHADAKLTLNTYSHATGERQRVLAAGLAASLLGAPLELEAGE